MVCEKCNYSWDPKLCKHCNKGNAILKTEYQKDEDGTGVEEWKCSWCSASETLFMTDGTKLPAFAKGYECPQCRYNNAPKIVRPCFLTSACVNYLGKPDNCNELQILRDFRDNYLSQTETGKSIIREYYDIAPFIVKKIDASPRRSEYYAFIYKKIVECIAAINANQNEIALEIYKQMVLYFKDIFQNN